MAPEARRRARRAHALADGEESTAKAIPLQIGDVMLSGTNLLSHLIT